MLRESKNNPENFKEYRLLKNLVLTCYLGAEFALVLSAPKFLKKKILLNHIRSSTSQVKYDKSF
jgi:hypothetical protein